MPIRVSIRSSEPLWAASFSAESLGRDPRFEIAGIAATAELSSLERSCKADVAVISVDADSATARALQVTRTLNTRQPDIRLVVLLEVGVTGDGNCGFPLWSNRRVLQN